MGQGALLLLAMSLLVFVAVYAIGNPITMLINPSSPPEVIEETIRRLGLDQPLHVQYWRFLTQALQGDLGVSYISSQPAIRLIVERFPATLELTLTAMAIALGGRPAAAGSSPATGRTRWWPGDRHPVGRRHQPADVLDRPDADHAALDPVRTVPDRRPRADRYGPGHSSSSLFTLRRLAPRRAARAQPLVLSDGAWSSA